MKIAINNFPLNSGHKIRGIGFYTKNLIDGLKKYSDIEVVEFNDNNLSDEVELVHLTWFDLFFKTLSVQNYPTVVTIHDVMPLIFKKQYPMGLKGRLNFYFQKKALQKTKAIITVSETSKKDIIKYLKIDPKKVFVTYEGIDDSFKILTTSQTSKIRQQYDLPNKFLLYVGDANYVKNLPFLIRGFLELKKDSKYQDLKLVLVGGIFVKNIESNNHTELNSLKEVNKLIKESNFQGDFIRPGFVSDDDLVGIYNLATIYIQPSLYEGFGLPILQAFACGTPVLSSNTSSLPEVGGDAAIYFDPKDENDFLKKLKEVLQSSQLQDKLSKKGLERSKLFDWEKVIDKTVKVYKKVLNQ